MAEIKLSADAIEDLKKIKSYISEELCNETAALHTISKITGSLRRLADFPQSGAPLASIVNLDTDHRFLPCGNYTAFYRYENGTVYVSRVLYGRRDFMRILFGQSEED